MVSYKKKCQDLETQLAELRIKYEKLNLPNTINLTDLKNLVENLDETNPEDINKLNLLVPTMNLFLRQLHKMVIHFELANEENKWRSFFEIYVKDHPIKTKLGSSLDLQIDDSWTFQQKSEFIHNVLDTLDCCNYYYSDILSETNLAQMVFLQNKSENEIEMKL